MAKIIKLADVLATQQAKQTGKQFTSNNSGVYMAWTHFSSLSGEYQKPLAPRDQAQLKRVTKVHGFDQTIAWIKLAISNWPKWSEHAASISGLAMWPTEPHVGFFSVHAHHSATFAPKSLTEPLMASKPSPKIPGQGLTVVQPIAEPQPTHEELLAALQEFKK